MGRKIKSTFAGLVLICLSGCSTTSTEKALNWIDYNLPQPFGNVSSLKDYTERYEVNRMLKRREKEKSEGLESLHNYLSE